MNIAILAGGTGGHIFPALAVGQALEQKGHWVLWIGTAEGMEAKIVPQYSLPFVTVPIQNLRGKGLWRHLLFPCRLLRAVFWARRHLRAHKIDLVLGFGGFVAGPGGLAAKWLRIPLLIHEQNAIAGMTNRYLAKIARFVLVAFSSSFPDSSHKIITGNPLRVGLTSLREQVYQPHQPLRLLVVGGSLGAAIFNRVLPAALLQMQPEHRPLVWQQTGQRHFEATRSCFHASALDVKITPFIDEIKEAYAWADLVICRSGALTVAELALIGKPAIFVPFALAADDHQTKNAALAAEAGAAIRLSESEFTAEKLCHLLTDFAEHTEKLSLMAARMKTLGTVDATEKIVAICEQFIPKRKDQKK